MRVLVGCERTGTVRRALRARGVSAWSCDLVPDMSDDPSFHLVGDVLELAPMFDALIVHPPCTYLASSGLHWNARVPGREQKTQEAVEFVRLIFALPLRVLCLENPIGRIGTAIRPADQVVQPYQFGEDASKATALWLRGLPLLKPTRYVEPRMVCRCGGTYTYERAFTSEGCPHCGDTGAAALPRWANQLNSGQNRLPPSADRAVIRSRTYPGIAEAMADQWRQYLIDL